MKGYANEAGQHWTTEDQAGCWQAVAERDAAADGWFVYAVHSTGVYCRPSCPSRRPRREGVSFFELPEAAEQAGFRPCRRCHPRDLTALDPQVELVQRACHQLEADEQIPSLADLGAALNISPTHLQRVFKRVMGISPRQYAEARRVDRLKTGLRADRATVTAALYDAGYGSSSRLYEGAPDHLGMTPRVYQRGGAGVAIAYALADCPLGRLLVAATERGVCVVSLGDDDAALIDALHAEYPHADIAPADPDSGALAEALAAVLAYLNGWQPHLDLPLDVRATAFQRRVWDELRRIPYGQTRTYQQVAQAIGEPTAVRAVARACATNPAALVIPCHRVIRTDGSHGGYRWGLARKAALLRQEVDSQA